MLMIVFHHFSVHTNFIWPENFTSNQYFVEFLASFGKVGVGIFFTITGYFLFKAKNLNPKKVFSTIRPVWFYSWLLLGVFIASGLFKPTFNIPLDLSLAQSIFPILTNTYWFVGAYIGLHLLAPYLKKWFDILDQRQIIKLLLIIVGVWNISSYLNFFIQGQFSSILIIPSAIFYALIGYYLHRFPPEKKYNGWAVSGLLFSTGMFLIGPFLQNLLSNSLGYIVPRELFWTEYSVFTVIFVISIFTLISQLKFQSRIINYIGGLTFGVYLIHDNILVRNWLWNDFLSLGKNSSSPFWQVLLIAFCASFGVFIVCAFLEFLRRIFTKLFFKICQIEKI